MPKEVIKEWQGGKPFAEVRWGSDHFDSIQLGVDRCDPFVFLSESEEEVTEYTGLYICLTSEEQVDRLIKALKRAKKKTF